MKATPPTFPFKDESNSILFSAKEIENEAEGVQSAFNLVNTQQIKIRQLTDENTQLKHQVDKLTLQLSQINLYKTQAQNLKRQLQACEEKLQLYDSENARREAEVKEQLNSLSTKEIQLATEIEQRDEIITKLKKRLELEAAGALGSTKNYHQTSKKLIDQIEELNNRVDSLSAELQGQQEGFDEERNALLNEIQGMKLEKTKAEARACELNETSLFQQEEIDKKNEMIKSFEISEKELAEELEKCHAHIEDQGKYIQELKEENKYIPQLSTNIKELTQTLEQTIQSLNKEKQKNTDLNNSKNSLEHKIKELKQLYSGNNSPEHLKEQLIQFKEKIEDVEEANKRLETQIRKMENGIKEQDDNIQKENEAIIEEFRFILGYIENEFSDIKSLNNKQVLKEPVISNDDINLCFNELKKLLHEVKIDLFKKISSLETENEQIKKDIIDIRASRTDHTKEIGRLKVGIKNQEVEISNKIEENKSLIEKYNVLDSKYSEANSKLSEIDAMVKKIHNNLLKKLSDHKIEMTSIRNIKELAEFIDNITNKLINKLKQQDIKITELSKQTVDLKTSQASLLRSKEEIMRKHEIEEKNYKNELESKQQEVFILAKNNR